MVENNSVDVKKSQGESGKYSMTISRMTVDKLGVKLYDKVSAVIAELVANGYDADATEVIVNAPMGKKLASPIESKIEDRGFTISVSDNGHGMIPDVVNDFYLKVGSDRRQDNNRSPITSKYNRKVMGRKGVGKLAPFGICNVLEVISSGGDLIVGHDEHGKISKGYKTAHFIMRLSDILTDEQNNYEPEVGRLDETIQKETGTKIILKEFNHRQVPGIDVLSRQIAQRFGISSADWKIRLVDKTKMNGLLNLERVVGDFDIQTMPGTKIVFGGPTTQVVEPSKINQFNVLDESKNGVSAKAGFSSSSTGKFYPIIGWVAYAKEPYKDDLMAGIRIYCRGKIAAQTAVFNLKAGFTGEHSVRSYLVGELHADWLDEEEDLIQTDRRDILWSDELGREFEKWGQGIVKLVGNLSREPEKVKIWEEFQETGQVERRVKETYPGEQWKDIRAQTMKLVRIMGERLRPAEAKNEDYVNKIVDYSLLLAPHLTLDDSLRKAAEEEDTTFGVMASILRTARIAELSSYGIIAEKRVKVIERMIQLKDDAASLEQNLQDSLEEAPWLINPFWSPIISNQSLSTLRSEFEKYFTKITSKPITLKPFEDKAAQSRPDFVLSADDFGLKIIEIKRPNHKLQNNEWDRIQLYIDQMDNFLNLEGHENFQNIFKTFTVTLVCDKIGLTGSQKVAFNSYLNEKRLEHITWSAFLFRTKLMHKEFLDEAERQKKLAANQ